MITIRDRLEIIAESEISGNTEDIQTIVIPISEKWQIKRITFADVKQPSNNWSGSFKVDFGVAGDRELLGVAYLFGDTFSLEIGRLFIGDGVKEFRIIRKNLGNQSKDMFVFMEGFKRINDQG